MSKRGTLLTDLVPKGYVPFVLWFFAGIMIIAGLEALYYYMPKLAQNTSDGRIASFDLDGEGSLAMWFSSTVLLFASATAFLVYHVRKQRPDDYFGRYRIWLWAGICWLGMSIDESSSLHEGFKEAITSLTGSRVMGDGSIWWVGAYLLVLSGIGFFLFVDMRPCRGSLAALFACGGCYAVAVLTQLEWILPKSGARGIMLEEGCEMVGNLFLWLSMGLHARYVILDAQGLITRPTRAPAKAKAASAELAEEERPVANSKAVSASKDEEPPKERSWLRWFRRSPQKEELETPKRKSKQRSASREAAADKPAVARVGERPATVQRSTQSTSTPSATSGDSYPQKLRLDEAGPRRLSKAERKALKRQNARMRDDDEDDDE